MDLLGGHRIEELETDEVETGLRFDDPALVLWLLGTEYRKVDPGEPGVESRAPHHVGDVHRTAVLELRQPALDAGDPRNSFHPDGSEVFGLDADQRLAGGDPLGAGLLADRSPGCQHAVKDDSTDERHQDAGGNAFGTEGDRTVAGSREHHLVGPRQFDGDLGARIARTDDEDITFLDLPRILVLGNVKLD